MRVYEQGEDRFLIDDSEPCFIKVNLGEAVGYVGVAVPGGTRARPYSWGVGLFLEVEWDCKEALVPGLQLRRLP